jgi:hypothetical protein
MLPLWVQALLRAEQHAPRLKFIAAPRQLCTLSAPDPEMVANVQR